MGKEHFRIDCHKCIYFYVTWESNHPYGCRKLGFKGKQLPSIVVRTSSGEKCMFFTKKKIKD